eukprot:scaffold3586_cov164-Amphora_coffeaeformis.AAC.13
MSSYYDLDAILSEEELVPCFTNFDFSFLSRLDPDFHQDDVDHGVLAENCKLKMPIWAMQKWGPLGYVKMVLPRHYARKAREKLEADPLQVDLRYDINSLQSNHGNQQRACHLTPLLSFFPSSTTCLPCPSTVNVMNNSLPLV